MTHARNLALGIRLTNRPSSPTSPNNHELIVKTDVGWLYTRCFYIDMFLPSATVMGTSRFWGSADGQVVMHVFFLLENFGHQCKAGGGLYLGDSNCRDESWASS